MELSKRRQRFEAMVAARMEEGVTPSPHAQNPYEGLLKRLHAAGVGGHDVRGNTPDPAYSLPRVDSLYSPPRRKLAAAQQALSVALSQLTRCFIKFEIASSAGASELYVSSIFVR